MTIGATLRKTVVIGAALALLAAPAANAGSLLSGYGGPGDGSQEILGASLVNTPSQPGGGPPSGSAPAESTSIAAPETPAAGPRAQRGRASPPARIGERGPGRATPLKSHSDRPTRLVLSSSGTVPAQPLGLTSGDLAALLLGLLLLGVTAMLTRWIARPDGGTVRAEAKGWDPRARVRDE